MKNNNYSIHNYATFEWLSAQNKELILNRVCDAIANNKLLFIRAYDNGSNVSIDTYALTRNADESSVHISGQWDYRCPTALLKEFLRID